MTLRATVLFVATSSNATPFRGGRTRIVAVANEVNRHNFRSRIICFVPAQQFSLGLKYLSAGKGSLEKESGSKVHYIPRLPFTRVVFIGWLNNWYCGFMAFIFCKWLNIKLIYGHGAEAGYIALFSKKIWKDIKVITDFHGASAEEYKYSKQLKALDKTAMRMVNYEALTLKQSDRVIFVSQAMRKYYENKLQIRIDRSDIIPCATATKFLVHTERREALRQTYGLANKLIICYVGSAVDYQLADKMCQLFGKIMGGFPSSFFLILSHHVDEFERHLEIAGIQREFYKILSVDHTQVFDLLQMGDIALLLRDDSLVNTVASPTKFAEYCLCGLPVIMTDFVGDFSEMVKAHHLGYIVGLTDLEVDDGLAGFIADVQEKRMDYVDRCTKFAKEHLSWDVYGDNIAKILINL
jgi:glycosyltransferase involved in cell wall biosynthesis